jgi:hypothetical protein
VKSASSAAKTGAAGMPGSGAAAIREATRALVAASVFLAALAFCRRAEADAPPPDSLKMTCARAQNYIVRNDGAVLATGNAYASFHSSYCSGQPAFARTKDAQYCYVGLYCDCELTYCAQSFFQGTDGGPAR